MHVTDTVVIGGRPAGPAASYPLTSRGLGHVGLERGPQGLGAGDERLERNERPGERERRESKRPHGGAKSRVSGGQPEVAHRASSSEGGPVRV